MKYVFLFIAFLSFWVVLYFILRSKKVNHVCGKHPVNSLKFSSKKRKSLTMIDMLSNKGGDSVFCSLNEKLYRLYYMTRAPVPRFNHLSSLGLWSLNYNI